MRDLLKSDDYRRAGYQQRKQCLIWMAIDDIEPQSKQAMHIGDCGQFQAVVSAYMKSIKRQPFAGLLALQIDLGATSRYAPQAYPAYTIVKNLLDLLGERRVRAKGERTHLLYIDDAKIQAPSVACWHSEEAP